MKINLTLFRLIAVIFAAYQMTAAVSAQSFYYLIKAQQFIQTGPAQVGPDPIEPFAFRATAATKVTLTTPTGGTIPLEFDPNQNLYSVGRTFTTKAALDAAFPNGTYTMTGTGIPTLTITVTGDLYPNAPQVIGGTWNAGGNLLVPPLAPTTLNFSPFITYGTTGVASYQSSELTNFDLGFDAQQILTNKVIPGLVGVGATVSPQPFSSMAISGGSLKNNTSYNGDLEYLTITSLDTTTLPGATIFGSYHSELNFWVSAVSSGTGGNPPVITKQPTDNSRPFGGTATFSVTVTVGGTASGQGTGLDWTFNGKSMDAGEKYTFPVSRLSVTINNLTAADAGNYAVRVGNTGGTVSSAVAVLTVTAAPAAIPDSSLPTFGINKQLNYEQTSAAAPTLRPTESTQFEFHLPANTSGTLRTPGGTTFSVNANADFTRRFANKAALDAAFPDGTYTLSVGGKTGITFPLTSTYPSEIPRITNGTWSAGKLVVDPSRDVTIQLSAFTGWGTVGALSAEYFSLWEGDGDDIIFVNRFSSEQASSVGGVTIPAGKLVAGHTYGVETGRFSNGVVDRSSVSGALGYAGGSYQLTFQVIAASAAATAPSIVTAPESQALSVGQSVTLGVGANGGGTYQWNKDGAAIAGATNSTLALTNVQTSAAGSYTVTVTNTLGSITSNASIVTVSTGPGLTLQPLSQNVAAGTRVTLTVAAPGTGVSYQWNKNGIPIGGATNASYVIAGAQSGDMGFYACTVTSGLTSTESTTATLTVVGGVAARPINLSTRALVTPAEPLTAGFVLSSAKTLLIRASGPALFPFNVPGTLVDPRLEIIPLGGSVPVATNDDWGLAANLSALNTAVAANGAFPFPVGSKDAAVLVTLPAGGYTARVTGAGSASGIALIEVYDTDPASSPGQLINISARAVVGTGASNLTTGFVVAGVAPRQVLIRAVGPGLSGFGVPGVLVDPQITIIPTGASFSIGTNDNWGGTAAVKSAFGAAGAFALDDSSRDAAVLLRLPPGGYTAVVAGVGGTTGTAIVEVYDLGP